MAIAVLITCRGVFMPSILIVDDNSQNLYLLELILKAEGYEVVTAENGEEALRVARQMVPDLIITDIFMPVMDGFVLCREWKKDERLESIPFIFYTATYTDPKDENYALSLGAEVFLTKPQEPEKIREVVREALSRNAGEAAARPMDEIETLLGYSQVLSRKLEQKASQLEKARTELAEISTAGNRPCLLSALDFVIIFGLSILLAITFNISNPSGIPFFPDPPDKVPAVDPFAMVEEYRQGRILLIDAMPANFYNKRHIKGAVNIPMSLFDIMYSINLSQYGRDQKIVVYGNSISGPYDLQVAGKLMLAGYTDVKVLEGGLTTWEAMGFPLDAKGSK